MSEQMNYMQRVGHSRCVRCDFETSDDMTFEQQDAAMMAHLADKHPDWMGIGQAEPSLREKLAKYKNIADAVEGYTEYMNADGLISAFIKEQERLRAELAQLRTRVAILDAQEVKLPELDAAYECQRDYGLSQPTGADYSIIESMARAQCREHQLLDALRALQACRGVAQQQNEALKFLAQDADGEISPATFEFANSAAAAYDALAGKGE